MRIADLLRRRRRTPLIRQTETAECGLACLAMVASHHGHELDIAALRERHPVASLKGLNLRGIISTARRLNLTARALGAGLGALQRLKLPVILHWDMNHFVVLEGFRRGKAEILDPARGRRSLTLEELSPHYTGVAVEFTPTADFVRERAASSLQVWDLWRRAPGLTSALGKVLGLSLLLHALLLLAPLLLQVVVDDVLPRKDAGLLAAVAVGFGGAALFAVVAEAVRSFSLLSIGSALHGQMAGNLMAHLLRLPLKFFASRDIGQMMSRLDSIARVRQIVTDELVSIVVDGVLIVVSLAMLVHYNLRLAALAAFAVLAYALLRKLSFRHILERSEDVIIAEGEEQRHFIETIKSIQAIKLYGSEALRQSMWSNDHVRLINADFRLKAVRILFKFASSGLLALEYVATVALGAKFALDGELSVGMLFAFLAYHQHFRERAFAFVDKAIELGTLRLHLDRLADIVGAEREELHRPDAIETHEPVTAIGFEGVRFRYAEIEPFVIDGLTLSVEDGDYVAIVGPSGCGKSTLLRLVLGLYSPSEGTIRVNGRALAEFGVADLRRQVGAVMQDDQLLSGSVAENIAFFDPELELERAMDCARQAAVHAEIEAMPMGYETLLTDQGSALSGGQRQRILLARALYRSPRILVLDEGTANLDDANERSIADVIEKLPLIRIVVSHRPELVKRAHAVYELRDGTLRLLRDDRQRAQVGAEAAPERARDATG